MNWKSYEEVTVNQEITQRWVREGDKYMNYMSLEEMEEFKQGVEVLKATIAYMFEQELKYANLLRKAQEK